MANTRLASINDINQINFTELAMTVKLTRNGTVPKNAGQVRIYLYKTLTGHIEPNQYAYQPNVGTTDAILHFLDNSSQLGKTSVKFV